MLLMEKEKTENNIKHNRPFKNSQKQITNKQQNCTKRFEILQQIHIYV